MFIRYPYMHAATADGSVAGGGAAAATPQGAATAVNTGAVQGQASGASAATALGAAGAANTDWLPEKFRVVAADGKTIDLEASARKLATEGYSPLEKRLGTGELPPAKVEDYKITAPQGLDEAAFADFTKDPATQEFVKAAHAKGLTNDQLNFVLDTYLKTATELTSGSQQMQTEQCTTQLKQVWKTEADYKSNMQNAYRAANALAAKVGMSFADLESAGLANNPLFIRLTAALGPELSEDVSVNANGIGSSAGTFDEQTNAIRTELEKLPIGDKRRAALLEKQNALYERKFPSRAPRVLKAP